MTHFDRLKQACLLTLIAALLASIAGAQTLTTTFITNNSASGNMFDLKTTGSAVIINDFDVNLGNGLTTQIDVWAVTGGGTFIGLQGGPAGWTLLGSAMVTSNGQDTPTNLGLSLGYIIPPASTQGFFITMNQGTGFKYNTAPAPLFGTLAATDGTLEIYHGIGKPLMPATYPAAFATANNGGFTIGVSEGRTFSGSIHYVPQSGLADDAALTSIVAPNDSVACEFLGNAEIIQGRFTNFGSNTILTGTLMQMSYVVDGGAAQTEFFVLPNDVALGQSYIHSFATPADLSAAGSHTIDVSVMLPGDLDAANDSKTKVVQSGSISTISTFPWIENFESVTVNNGILPPAGWTQDLSDGTGTNSDWFFKTGTTGSVNTGPNGDHTSGLGYYAYTEDNGNFAQINLDTPCLDLATLVAPQLDFWLHSFNSNATPTTNQNFFSVDVIAYPGGTVTTDVVGPIGHQAAANWASSTWQKYSVNLSAFSGQLVQIRFRGQTTGGSTTHDLAIDDIALFEPVATPGQAAQPGLAVFDIENARNNNLASVDSGFGGPFFTTVTQGQPFTLHFEGEPFQPIVVVYGALNPVAATYPNGIGQFDIGGPGVDANGIPLNIAVFVNAIGWVQAGAPGFPFDAVFFTKTSGELNVGLAMPAFGIPTGTVLTTFQSAIASGSSPFVRISNAIQVTLN